LAWLEPPLLLEASDDELEPLLAAVFELLGELVRVVELFEFDVPDPSVVTAGLALVAAEPTPRTTAVPTAPAAPRATTPCRARRVRLICCSRVVMERG
jgi:hypothetical protein